MRFSINGYNCNQSPIFHRFRDTATESSEISIVNDFE